MTQDPRSTWYDDFFTELPNAFWRAAVPPDVTTAEIDFLVRWTGLRPGHRVLDVCCGSGRHARPIPDQIDARGHLAVKNAETVPIG